MSVTTKAVRVQGYLQWYIVHKGVHHNRSSRGAAWEPFVLPCVKLKQSSYFLCPFTEGKADGILQSSSSMQFIPYQQSLQKNCIHQICNKKKDDEPSGFELMRHVYFSPINK
jgi:hypothetical protein